MKNYIIRKVLKKNDIETINSILPNLKWEDGLNSAVELTKKQKNNLESESDLINNIIMSAIDLDSSFYDYTIPKESTKCLISKMECGGYYQTHEDLFYVGHFSTTVFLSNKDDYEGGELCLLVNDEEIKIKLDCGYAITYPTGLLHRVNNITSGERIVSVFWTKTLIQDEFIRNIYSDAHRLRNILKESYFDHDPYEQLKSYKDNPYFLSNSICNAIMRKYVAL